MGKKPTTAPTAESSFEAKPTAAIAQPALPVSEGISADHALAPNAAPQEGESLEQAIARIKGMRSPFGSQSLKLAMPTRHGYHRHWFNDVAGRIDEATTSGWANVKDLKTGQPLKRTVGSGRDGGALIAYAMEIPEVFWQEEMDARHKTASEKLESIKKNPFASKPGQAQASDKGKFYDPTEGTGSAGPLTIQTPQR
jgi:hypothetical protein